MDVRTNRSRLLIAWITCILIPGGLGVLGCASAAGRTAGQPRACGLESSDSLFAAGGPVYRECAVDAKAQPITPNSRFDFQPPRGGPDCYSAEVEFVVSATGYPEMRTARVVRATERSFGDALLAAVGSWRYRPATKDGQPVRQIVVERRGIQMVAVVVPAGHSPPSRPPTSAMLPTC